MVVATDTWDLRRLSSQAFRGMGTRRAVLVQWTCMECHSEDILKIFIEGLFCSPLNEQSRMEQRLCPRGACSLECPSRLVDQPWWFGQH